MFADKIKQLHRWVVGAAVLSWGAFAMALTIDYSALPEPLFWLAVVVALAFTAAGTAALYFRYRNRQIGR